jgi:Uma2 family endonuclease
MSLATKPVSADRIIIRDVSWETYQCLLKDLENRSAPRLAYDRGVLEITSPHFGHEEVNRALASIVEIVLEEMEIDFRNAGSTTFKKEDQERGFEPDLSFYIQNVERVRGKKKFDMNIDPPPDLLIEVDLTHDSLNKFPLYTALAVPEVWRYTDDLEIWILNESQYRRASVSHALHILTENVVSQWLESSIVEKRPAWLRQTRQRVRDLIRAR